MPDIYEIQAGGTTFEVDWPAGTPPTPEDFQALMGTLGSFTKMGATTSKPISGAAYGVQDVKTGAYKYGGSPGSKEGTDCSGAMCVLAQKAGINLPRTAKAQFEDKRAKPVDSKDLKPGDFVFFGSPGPSGWHVGMYVGDGKFAHQSTDAKPDLSIADLASHMQKYGWRGARRYEGMGPKAPPPPKPTAQDNSDNLILKAAGLAPQEKPKPAPKKVETLAEIAAKAKKGEVVGYEKKRSVIRGATAAEVNTNLDKQKLEDDILKEWSDKKLNEAIDSTYENSSAMKRSGALLLEGNVPDIRRKLLVEQQRRIGGGNPIKGALLTIPQNLRSAAADIGDPTASPMQRIAGTATIAPLPIADEIATAAFKLAGKYVGPVFEKAVNYLKSKGGNPNAVVKKEVVQRDVPQYLKTVEATPAKASTAPKAVETSKVGKEPWEMTKDEYLDANPVLEGGERAVSLNEFRAMKGYRIPGEDHGAYRMPHGITKAHTRRLEAQSKVLQKEYDKSLQEYLDLKDTGQLPTTKTRWNAEFARERPDGSNAAGYRAQHKRQITKALTEGKPVPAEVLADYPDLATKYGTKAETPTPPTAPKGGEVPQNKEEITPLAAGLNPIDVIKRADDLDIPGFTASRRPKDFHVGHNFTSPLSIVDETGKTLQRGTYERIGGLAGKQASVTIRDAEREITQNALAYERMVDIVDHQLEAARKQLGVKDKGKFAEEFVDLIEKNFDDASRVGRNPAEQEALMLHDRMTDEFKNYIVKSRKEVGIEMPENWGITDKGYFRHLFLGDVVLKDGDTLIGTAKTYAEAQKKAVEYLKSNPDANISAEARNIFAGDPTLRVSTRRYFKTVGDIADRVGISKEDIMEDIRGVIGRQGAKQKFFGALLKREGAKGFDKAYTDVMRFHAQQMVRTQELSKLNKAIQPVIENIRAGKGTPGNSPLPGLADAVQDHVNALWGTPSKIEKQFGEALSQVPVVRNYVGSPAMAMRGMANQITRLQSVLKLHVGLKAPIVNALQPFTTLWPYISTKEFAEVYKEALKPAARQMLAEKGVFTSATKLEKGGAVATRAKASSPFAAASELNRAVGYVYGYKSALKRGASEKAAHANGLNWAEKVEFDNSVWNAPPALRNPIGRVAGQFKGFTIKNVEQIISQLGRKPGEGRLAPASRILKTAAALGAQGGVSAVGPVAYALGGYKVVTAIQDALESAGMDKKDAKEWASAIYYGAPSLIGVNISGSVSILDAPYGNTPEEQFINFALGPTGSLGFQGIKSANAYRKAETKDQKVQAAVKFAKSATPAAREAEILSQLIKKGPNGVSVRVGTNDWVKLAPHEAILMVLGFYPRKLSEKYDKKESAPKSGGGGLQGLPGLNFPTNFGSGK